MGLFSGKDDFRLTTGGFGGGDSFGNGSSGFGSNGSSGFGGKDESGGFGGGNGYGDMNNSLQAGFGSSSITESSLTPRNIFNPDQSNNFGNMGVSNTNGFGTTTTSTVDSNKPNLGSTANPNENRFSQGFAGVGRDAAVAKLNKFESSQMGKMEKTVKEEGK